VTVLHPRAYLSGKQVFYCTNNCTNNCTISLYICTRFARYLDGILYSWIIILRIARELNPFRNGEFDVSHCNTTLPGECWNEKKELRTTEN